MIFRRESLSVGTPQICLQTGDITVDVIVVEPMLGFIEPEMEHVMHKLTSVLGCARCIFNPGIEIDHIGTPTCRVEEDRTTIYEVHASCGRHRAHLESMLRRKPDLRKYESVCLHRLKLVNDLLKPD